MNAAVLILVAGFSAGSLPDAAGLAKLTVPSAVEETSDKDGSQTPEWGGPGQSQIKISQRYLVRRDKALDDAAKTLAQLTKMLESASSAVGRKAQASYRAKLQQMAGKPMDDVKANLLAAAEWEAKRLNMVDKAVRNARERDREVPKVDPDVIDHLLQVTNTEDEQKKIGEHAEAYRNIALAYADFLGDDLVSAMKKMEVAVAVLDELPMVHVYLGSFYFLARSQDQAIAEWQRALELDPGNKELEKMVVDLAAEQD